MAGVNRKLCRATGHQMGSLLCEVEGGWQKWRGQPLHWVLGGLPSSLAQGAPIEGGGRGACLLLAPPLCEQQAASGVDRERPTGGSDPASALALCGYASHRTLKKGTSHAPAATPYINKHQITITRPRRSSLPIRIITHSTFRIIIFMHTIVWCSPGFSASR